MVQLAGGPVQWTQHGRGGGAVPAALGQDTRAGLAEMSRMAAALEDGTRDADRDGNYDDGNGWAEEEEAEWEAEEEEEEGWDGGGEVQLGLTAHFLFNFTVEAIRREHRGGAQEVGHWWIVLAASGVSV